MREGVTQAVRASRFSFHSSRLTTHSLNPPLPHSLARLRARNQPRLSCVNLSTVRKLGTYLAVFFALTTVAAVAFALRERQRASDLQAQYDAVAAQKADADKRLADAQKRAKDLEVALAAAKERPHVAANDEEGGEGEAAGGPPTRERRGNRRGGDPMGNLIAMLDNPQIAQMFNAQQRSQLDSRYAELFKNLKLSPADLQKFKDLLVEKQNSFRDVLAAARAQGLDPRQDRDAYRALVQQANQDIDNSIQSMLGADGFAQYKQYEQTLPQRNLVSQLNQRLSYTDVPLTQNQSDQLVQLLAQTAPTNGNNNNPMRGFGGFGGFGGDRVPITDQTIAQASTVLSQSQVAALQQLQAEQQQQQQARQLLRGQRIGGPGAANPGGAGGPGGGTASPAPRPTG